ncbi:MAG: protein meaA [Pseudomonadota bacterium]
MKETLNTISNKDRPWMFRTYAGHSTAQASNELFRSNLVKGQTGLSVAFDLPTQTGYDSDHILARGEVGKVGVPISHLGDMRTLFKNIPLQDMNTSMTINATAAWLLALYVSVADEQGVDRKILAGTTQNDIIKEYLSRGTYVFPPQPSMRLIKDTVIYTYQELPKWNPTNVCSYHLQEAGATPVQELAYALATAISVLDAVKASNDVQDEDFSKIIGRISFFVNASPRFITEMCKMRAFVELWDNICLNRYGVTEEKYRRFRYGVQVNSLGLTEQQPENNVYRILLAMLSVVLSKKARARAVQLPAWNEALGLPRPWDQQWSLRLQQVAAYETDLLEYGDLFDGSELVTEKVNALKEQALEELAKIDTQGGALRAIEAGYMKEQLVISNRARLEGIEHGSQIVVGVNHYTETERSPLSGGEENALIVPDYVETEQIARLKAWRERRNDKEVANCLAELKACAQDERNIMPASIACAKAGITTGEWGGVLREVFGEYRAPTGVKTRNHDGTSEIQSQDLDAIRKRVQGLAKKLDSSVKFMMGKPGLDGHSNGAEQIALRADDVGFEVIYDGIRLTPEEIVASAKEKKIHILGLSILSGSHVAIVQDVVALMRTHNIDHIPVIVGGIIPPEDEMILKQCGVIAVYTPKDFQLNKIMQDMVNLVEQRFMSLEKTE